MAGRGLAHLANLSICALGLHGKKLSAIQAPTLVAREARDQVAPQAWVAAITAQLAKGQLYVIPKGPHCVNYTTPGALTQVVQRFVEEIVKRRSAFLEGAVMATRLYNDNLSR